MPRKDSSWWCGRLVGDLEHDLSGLAGSDDANGLLGLFERKAMRDHGPGIELARAKKARHHQPRVVHASADDAIDRESLEDDLRCEIEIDGSGGDAKHLDASS